MNILQLICPTGYYGAERWIVALANNLKDPNISTKLVIITEDGEQEFELEKRYPTSKGSVLKLEMRSRFDLRAIRKLIRIIDEQQIDIIHSHGYKADVMALLTKYRRKSLRILSTPHGLGVVSDLKLRIFNKIGLISLRYFDIVAPLSPALTRLIEQAGVPKNKIRFIPNGVDLTEMDRCDPPTGEKDKGKRIGYIGRLASGKQVEAILRVFNSLWLQDGSLTLHIAGTGEELEQLQSFATELPSHDAIEFLGFVENRFNLMQTLDLFIMTSVSEGTPRSIMEALYLKIPVVAYDVEGVDQLIVNEETGLLASLNDEKTLEIQCHRILNDKDLINKLAENGRSRIVNTYAATRMATSYESLYIDLVSSY